MIVNIGILIFKKDVVDEFLMYLSNYYFINLNL